MKIKQREKYLREHEEGLRWEADGGFQKTEQFERCYGKI